MTEQADKPASNTLVQAVYDTAEVVADPTPERPYVSWIAAQAVAQSTTIAVQDGAQYLRNVSAMATSAIGAAMAQMLSTRDPSYADIIAIAQRAVDVAAASFERIGASAARVSQSFPSGSR